MHTQVGEAKMFQSGSVFQIKMNKIAIITVQIKEIPSFVIRYLKVHLPPFNNRITFFFSAEVPSCFARQNRTDFMEF